MNRRVMAFALGLGLSCGPTTATIDEGDVRGELSSALTTEERLKVLRSIQVRERDASRALQKVIDPRLEAFRDQRSKERLISALVKKNPNDPYLTIVRASAAKDEALVKSLQSTADALAKKHLAVLDELAAELQKQRLAALPEATRTGKSGEFPLHVAVADFSWSLSRRLPTLHTEVQSLRKDVRCAGDLIIDGTLDRYLRATLDESDEAALRAMKMFQQQLSCLSARQLRVLEDKLVTQVDITLAHQLGKTIAPEFASRFRQLVAAPILLLADQTRAFSASKPGLKWLQKNQPALVLAAKSRGSLLHRAGLYVIDPRAKDLLIISSKGQRSPKGNTLLALRDPKGEWTTNLLPAFLEALTSPCYGADLVLEGTQAKGEGLTCDVGCGAATKDTARLGKGLTRGLVSSPSAQKACPTTGTTAGGGSGTGSSGSGNPGSGGVTIGAGAQRTGCVMDAVMGDRADTVGKVVSCLSALHPGSGAMTSPTVGLGGGTSCRPSVASNDPDDLTPGEIDAMGGSDDGTRTYTACDEAGQCRRFYERTEDDGTVTTTDHKGNVIDNSLPGESPNLPGNGTGTGGGTGGTGTGGGAGSGGTPSGTGGSGGSGGSGGTGGGSGSTGGGTGSGSTGGGSGGSGGGGGGGGDDDDTSEQDELDAQGNPHNDNGEDQCGTEPQCRESAAGSCDRESGSCSGGCTGNDLGTAFAACVSDVPERSNPVTPGGGDPNVIYPAPDTSAPSGVGGILACAAGGTPAINTCARNSVALCPDTDASCACSKRPVVNAGMLDSSMCQAVQCAGQMSSSSEALMSGASGLSDCGCTSVLGG
jgi:hypothetical protein